MYCSTEDTSLLDFYIMTLSPSPCCSCLSASVLSKKYMIYDKSLEIVQTGNISHELVPLDRIVPRAHSKWWPSIGYFSNVIYPFSYSNSSNATIIKKLCKSKNLFHHRVVIRKNPLQITSDHFRMTTLSFDEFFRRGICGSFFLSL